MPKIESLKNYIDELISEVEKELDESTATGDIAGYETPNAFSDNSDATKRRKKKIATQLGMQLVGKVESVSEATTSFVSGNSGRTITHLDNKKYQLTKDVKGAQIGNYHSVVLPKGSIIHNLPGGVFVSHPSLKDKFSGTKETPKFGFRVTTNSDTLITIEKSSKILESVNEYNLNDIIKQVKTYDKPKDAKLLTIKVINKLKDSRNKANSSKKIEIQKVIDAIEGEYNKGKYLKLESVNENRWLELKNDESMHANKKLAVGLRELKNQLKEVETFFRWYNQIKTMNELDSNQYWKRTNSHIYKIKERIINIARTLKEIEQ